MRALIIIWVAVLISGAAFVGVVYEGTMPAAYADKYDGDCQPGDTAGRCADSCSDGQYLQGYDKDTGAAVCHDDADVSQTGNSDTQPAPSNSTDIPATPENVPTQYVSPTNVIYWEGK